VWRADLAAVADELGELLSGDEHARAARFAGERDGELWRRARGLLRELLGRYLQRDARLLRFATGEHGKPALVHDALAFNMSHSEQLALYAFSAAGAVGVDVEVARHSIDELAVASRMLGAAEAQRLEALDPDARRREFLRAWARHEAELKCLGVGIGGVDRANARPLWVTELEMHADAGAAVAAERPARELRCWEWRG
jgi:4'-phosphopantetheinyl transferase